MIDKTKEEETPHTATHTPTPWWIDWNSDPRPGDRQYIVAHYGDDEISIGDVITRPDAEFIVHAVNAHADLVAALEAAKQAMNFIGPKWTINTKAKREFYEAYEKAQAALQKEKA